MDKTSFPLGDLRVFFKVMRSGQSLITAAALELLTSGWLLRGSPRMPAALPAPASATNHSLCYSVAGKRHPTSAPGRRGTTLPAAWLSLHRNHRWGRCRPVQQHAVGHRHRTSGLPALALATSKSESLTAPLRLQIPPPAFGLYLRPFHQRWDCRTYSPGCSANAC